MIIENNISQDLEKILISYTLDQPIDNISDTHKELLHLYLNDKNSSTLRQFITSKVCKYKNNFKKFGYDAIDDNGFHKEVKPTNSIINPKRKHVGEFGFSDYTLDRYNQDVSNNVNLVQSFFVEGKLVYIVEFPIKELESRMQELVVRYIINKGQRYIRKAAFSLNDIELSKVEVKYVSPNLIKYKDSISNKVYEKLKGYNEKNINS